jgi:hypothetical protein
MASLVLGASLLFGVPLVSAGLLGCGGAGRTVTPLASAQASQPGGPSGQPSVDAPSPPPSDLPPMAQMPPPGVRGSTAAKLVQDPRWRACSGGVRGRVPATELARLTQACGQVGGSQAKHRKVLGPITVRTQETTAREEHVFRAEAGACYRVYSAYSEDVEEIAVTLRDASGALVLDESGNAAPREGLVCFQSATEVTIAVALGRGKGTWLLEVWSHDVR